MRRITVVDLCATDELDVLAAARAVERQIADDFSRYWRVEATLRVVRMPAASQASSLRAVLDGSDGIIYVSPNVGSAANDPVGFHFSEHPGTPAGFVFPGLAAVTGAPWTVALSHEVLEFLADPDVNLLVGAPHPTRSGADVLRPYEVCDPVQARHYEIDAVAVADFVTPQYFTIAPRRSSHGSEPTHFLGTEDLPSFGTLQGGTFNYYDLDTRDWAVYPGGDDVDPVTAGWRAARKDAGRAPRTLRRVNVGLDGRGGPHGI